MCPIAGAGAARLRALLVERTGEVASGRESADALRGEAAAERAVSAQLRSKIQTLAAASEESRAAGARAASEYARAVRQKDAELELLSGLLQATSGAGGASRAVTPLRLFAATGSPAALRGMGGSAEEM